MNIAHKYTDDHLVLLYIYDYRSHKLKLILSDKKILSSKAEWVLLRCHLDDKDMKTIYKLIDYREVLPQ